MYKPLDRILRWLADDFGACAAVISNAGSGAQSAVVLTTYPDDLLLPGSSFPLPDETTGSLQTDPAQLAALVPTTLRIELPAAAVAARSFALNDSGLTLLVVWCDLPDVDATADARLRGIVDQLGNVAPLVQDARVSRTEAQRLGAVVSSLGEGVVTVDSTADRATVNPQAAKLLSLSPEGTTAQEVADAMQDLLGRALNRAEITATNSRLLQDPLTTTECVWRFSGHPTHIRVTSIALRDELFSGRLWVFSDESTLNQALDASQRAETAMRATTDAMIDPQALIVALRDSEDRVVDFSYVDVNSATCEYLGMSRDELLATTLVGTFPNVEPSGLLAHFVECVNAREPVVLDDFRYYNEVLDEARRYDIRGALAGTDTLSLTWRDVTERFAAAQRIAESEERFRLLAENVGDVVCRTRQGRVVWISNSVEQMLGAPPDHWMGRHVSEIVTEQAVDGFRDRITQVSSGQTYIGRALVHAADGTPHWVHLNAKPYFDVDGNPDGAVSSFRLIDDEVAALDAIEEARQLQAEADARYRRLMENASVGTCLTSPAGVFEVVNPALCEFFGYDAETLCRKTWQELTVAEYLEVDLRKVDDIAAGRIDGYRLTKQFIHARGRRIWGDLSVSCLRDDTGRVEKFIAQITDITAEVEARQLIEMQEEQNRILARRLQVQTDRLTSELDSAARYIASLLPVGLDGAVEIASRYRPATELAGDCYDFTWIDDDHLVVYLLDVSGHGVAPALQSISVHNMLRSAALPRETMLDPVSLLVALNQRFQMDQQGGHYFTIWYGVYEKSTRTLRHANAGHPPALLFVPGAESPVELGTDALPVGMFDDAEFTASSIVIPPAGELLLYSDGAYELALKDGTHWTAEQFVAFCAEKARRADWSIDSLLDSLRGLTPTGFFEDDCSLVKLIFH